MMLGRIFRIFLIIIACLLVISLFFGSRLSIKPKELSDKKLGLDVLAGDSDTARKVIDACPRIMKFVLDNQDAPNLIYRYKKTCPGGTVIARVLVPAAVKYNVTDNPAESAGDYWKRISNSQLRRMDKQSIAWLEGPGETGIIPRWYSDETASRWAADFWSELADLMHENGYNPSVGSIAAGQPQEISYFKPIVDSMKSKNYAWAWSYHAYSRSLSSNMGEQIRYPFYYRKIKEQLHLEGVPLILGEGGFLDPTSPPAGWQERFNDEEYFTFLRWMDWQIQEDPEVLGLAVFQTGNQKEWKTFDVSPISGRLAEYLGKD